MSKPYLTLTDEQIKKHLEDNPDGEGQRFIAELINQDLAGLGNDLQPDDGGVSPEKELDDVIIESDLTNAANGKKLRVVSKNRRKLIEQFNVQGNNKWPYSDSYAPKLKLIRDDKLHVKERLHRSNVKGALDFDQLKVRKADIFTVEDQYREKMKEASRLRVGTREVVKQWSKKTIINATGPLSYS